MLPPYDIIGRLQIYNLMMLRLCTYYDFRWYGT